MVFATSIVNHKDYDVHKGFHPHVPCLHTYLVRILGVDCDTKSRKKKKQRADAFVDTVFRYPNDKFSAFSECIFFKKKKKKSRRKSKSRKDRYETVEETI